MKVKRRILKPYRSNIDITPLMIEITVSVLAGFFLLFWGMIFFSNTFYQQSKLTKLRNTFIGNAGDEEIYRDVTILSPDIDDTIINNGENDSSYLLKFITDAVSVCAEFARNGSPDSIIVLGIDYAIAGADFSDEELRPLADLIGSLPPNFRVVFGTFLLDSPGGPVSGTQHLFSRIAGLSKTPVRTVPHSTQIYFGSIETLNATVTAGFEGGGGYSIAAGYQPLIPVNSTTVAAGASVKSVSAYLSFPLAMFAAGEINPLQFGGNPSEFILSDYGSAAGAARRQSVTLFISEDGADSITVIEERTGYSREELSGPVYYDIRTSNDTDAVPGRFYWLSDFRALVNNAKPGDSQGVKYIFAIPPLLPAYFSEADNDLTLTSASGINRFTGEYTQVRGVVKHITALSNLRNARRLVQKPGWSVILSVIFGAAVIVLSAVAPSFFHSLLWTSGLMAAFVLIIFTAFTFGNLISWNLGLGLILGGFIIMSFIRLLAADRQ